MMNALALCLVLTSIVSGGFFSPPPPQAEKMREDLIIKEVNRVIMVENERETRPPDTGNISPLSEPSALEEKLAMERAMSTAGVIDSTKKKVKEVSSVLPNIGGHQDDHHHYNAKELICDVYGKCKHKIAGVFGEAKDGAEEAGEKAKEVFDKARDSVYETGKTVMDNVKEGVEKAKETGKEAGETIVDKTRQGLEKAKGRGKEAGETFMDKAKEGVEKAKETGIEAGETVMDKTKEGLEKAKGRGKEAGETVVDKTKEGLEKTKEAFGKAKDSVYETGETVMDNAKEKVEKAKERGKEAGETVIDKAKEELEKAKGRGKGAGETVVDKTKEGLEKAKETVYETEEIAMEKTKKELGKAKDTISEKVKEAGEKAKVHVKNIGLELRKGHHSLWDERSIQTKANWFFLHGVRNFTNIFHRGSDVFYDAAKLSVSKKVVYPTTGAFHLVGLASAYGISVWVTFLSSHVLAGALPKQQFGIVQSKIYPVYFKALVVSIGCSLLAHALRHPLWGLKTIQAYNLLATLALVLFNLLYLEPRATKVMFDRMKLEKEEGRGLTGEEEEEFVEAPKSIGTSTAASDTPAPTATTCAAAERSAAGVCSARREDEYQEVRSQVGELDRKLKSLNSISSLLNVLCLMALTWQLVDLGRGIPVT